MKNKVNVISLVAFSLIGINFCEIKANVQIKDPSVSESKIFLKQVGKNLKNSNSISKKINIVSDKKVNSNKKNFEKDQVQSQIFRKIKKEKLKKIIWISGGILAVGTISFIIYLLLKRHFSPVLAGTGLLPSASKAIIEADIAEKANEGIELKTNNTIADLKINKADVNKDSNPIQNNTLIISEQYKAEVSGQIDDFENETAILNDNPITDDIVFSAQQYEDIGEYDNAFHDDKTNKFEKKVLEEIQKKVNSFPDIIDPQKKRSVILDEMLMESVKEDNSMLNKKNPAPQETKKKQPQHEEILKMQTDLNLRPQSNETETNNKTRSSNSFFSKIFGRRKNSNEQNSRSTSSKQAQEELDNYMRERRKKIDELNYLKKRGIRNQKTYQLEAQLKGVAYAI